jgi:pimeloyl-ACP methyl ester carboxylesterase
VRDCRNEFVSELRGSGEPVVLIHWGVAATWAEPLLNEPALVERHRLLSYHRAGFAGSSSVDGPLTMDDHAEHCRLLMCHLGLERAHIVGHSSSAVIALQLALDSPDCVQTLVSMEAARPVPSTETQAAFLREFVQPAVERYRHGDKAGAVDTFFRGVFGSEYRDDLDRGLPDAFDQAVADADAFFMQELPPFSAGRLPRRTQGASHSRCLPSSGRTALRLSPSGGSCSCPGCRTSSRSTYPTPRIYFTCRNLV